MNTLSELQDYVRTLSDEQFKVFFAWMGEMMQLNFISKNIHTEFKESRFKGGHVCILVALLVLLKMGTSKANNAISVRIAISNSTI